MVCQLSKPKLFDNGTLAIKIDAEVSETASCRKKEKSGRHGLFLRCWLPAWQVGREPGAGRWELGVIVKSLAVRAKGRGGGWKRARKV